jgi:hypothetical protein
MWWQTAYSFAVLGLVVLLLLREVAPPDTVMMMGVFCEFFPAAALFVMLVMLSSTAQEILAFTNSASHGWCDFRGRGHQRIFRQISGHYHVAFLRRLRPAIHRFVQTCTLALYELLLKPSNFFFAGALDYVRVLVDKAVIRKKGAKSVSFERILFFSLFPFTMISAFVNNTPLVAMLIPFCRGTQVLLMTGIR